MSIKAPPRKHLWVWLLWLVAFYATWLFLLQAEGAWTAAKDHWPIARRIPRQARSKKSPSIDRGFFLFLINDEVMNLFR
jgi:hypothetical protein